MGNFLIKINDWLMILLVIILALIGTAMVPVVGTIAGFVIGAAIGGFWFVLSGIYQNGKRTIELLELINRREF